MNSKNFMEQSPGTRTWIAECERLVEACTDAARRGRESEARTGFEILLDLLRYVDEGNDDVVFFADEGGSWVVGVRWKEALPAYFGCLVAHAAPEDYARIVLDAVEHSLHYDRKRALGRAASMATPAQAAALRRHARARSSRRRP